MKKKKLYNSHKVQKAINRENEIKEHGKLISLRPGRIFRSKKEYRREKFRRVDYED